MDTYYDPMRLSCDPAQDRMDSYLARVYPLVQNNLMPEVGRVYDEMVAEIDEISLITRQEDLPRYCYCHHYALGVELAEPWIGDSGEMGTPEILFEDTFRFLCEKGFHPVRRLSKTTLVVYSFYHEGERCTGHFGVHRPDDKFVLSKWAGSGPVIRHPVNFVPRAYGTHVWYFNKP